MAAKPGSVERKKAGEILDQQLKAAYAKFPAPRDYEVADRDLTKKIFGFTVDYLKSDASAVCPAAKKIRVYRGYGAQLIVQNADGVTSLRQLARLLADHLQTEQGVHVEDVNRVPARGGEAYGFTFSVSDEARGRVAVVRAGEHVALVIASWPMGAPPAVAEDVESMIGSLGPPPNALPPGVF